MILKMEKLSLHGHAEDKEKIIAALMGQKCVQLIPPEELPDFDTISGTLKRDMPSVYESESKLSEISSALAVLKEYEKKPGMFSQKPELGFDDVLDMSKLEAALTEASVVRGVSANISEVKSFQSHDQFVKSSLLPWSNLDIDFAKAATKTSDISFFTIPSTVDSSALSEELAKVFAAMEVVSEEKDIRYVATAHLKDSLGDLNSVMRENGGLAVSLPITSGTVTENLGYIEKRLSEYAESHKVLVESLSEHAADTSLLKGVYDRLSTAIAAERVRQNLLLTDETFFLSAWLPSKDKVRIESVLSKFTCFYEFSAPEEGEEEPIKFKNSSIVEPFEVITEMYGYPSSSSIDPNPFIAPFFFLFFGMMLSDAGYGVLLVIAGFIMSKRTKAGTFSNKLFKLIGLCGISTIFWGAVYGGWFGDIITVVAKTFFNKDILVPALINPLLEPMTIMIISFAFGAIHLFVGMGIKAYLLIRRGHMWDAVFDIGFWYCVLIGLVMLFFGGLLSKIGMVLAIGGAIGLILTQGRDKKNILSRLISGVMSLYDITGYFSDVLSYSRILALGLATGVIASVVNILATLPGANIIGFIFFVIIFVGGHAFNLAINALGSYVHTSRLQYVEFFGKFFEGGGRPFTPLGAAAKYNVVNNKEE